MKISVACILLIPTCLFGCGLSPRERDVIDLTRQAGAVVAADVQAAPATRQAGQDVAANMGVVQAEYGLPDAPVTYIPAMAADTRKRLEAEYATPPAAVGWLGGLADKWAPGASALVAGAWAVWKTIQARREAVAHRATLHGVEGALAGFDPLAREKAEREIARCHAAAGAGVFVKKKLVRLGFAKPG